MLKLAVIAGDGVGPEVIAQALKVAKAASEIYGFELLTELFDFGAEKYLQTGESLPSWAVDELQTFDAVLLGALGDPRIPDMKHAEDILLGLRRKLDLYANIRPVKLLNPEFCPLKRNNENIDFVVIRENTEGAYSGCGKIEDKDSDNEKGIQFDVNTFKGVERVIRYAFEYARKKKYSKVTMSDKSNAMRYGHAVWQRAFEIVRKDFPEIKAEHRYIDVLNMEIVNNPEKFGVIVTCNMFGDILSDLGAAIQGGIGIAPSCNFNPQRGYMLFEPVHGSAPDIAGKGIANPVAAIRCISMLFEYSNLKKASIAVEEAVKYALTSGNVTADLGGKLTTEEAGDLIVQKLREN